MVKKERIPQGYPCMLEEATEMLVKSFKQGEQVSLQELIGFIRLIGSSVNATSRSPCKIRSFALHFLL